MIQAVSTSIRKALIFVFVLFSNSPASAQNRPLDILSDPLPADGNNQSNQER